MQQEIAFRAAEDRLLKMLTLDFTAILVGYNLARDDARRVAAQAVKPVVEHFANSGSVLRRKRL